MTRFVALLRGVNVGGHNRMAMADLRVCAEALGHTEVATYIQSGNLVLSHVPADEDAIADELEREIARRLSITTHVVVLSQGRLEGVRAGNPFPEGTDPRRLHVSFSRHRLPASAVRAVSAAQERAAARGSPDRAEVVEGVLYLHTPDGLGRSVLAAELVKGTTTAPPATMRSWATVGRLSELLAQTGA